MFKEKMNRREMLQESGKAIGLASLAITGNIYLRIREAQPILDVVIRIAESIPDTEDEKRISYPHPGWLETQLPARPPFLDSKTGASTYLRQMVTTIPILSESFTRVNRKMGSSPPVAPLLGDVFKSHLGKLQKRHLKTCI